MDSSVTKVYGNKVRLRVCGMCWADEKLLLVNHRGLGKPNFWAPPGGGMEFGDSIEGNLKREFAEETGLTVEIGPFLFGCEHLAPPLHSVELFYRVSIVSGELRVGKDPELNTIKDVRFFDVPAGVADLNSEQLHGIFRFAKTQRELRELCGFYRI